MKMFNTTVMPIVALMLVMAPIAANAADPYVQTKFGLNGTTLAGISTGYCMTTNSRVEVDFAMTVLDSTTVGSRVFGVEDADGKGGMVLKDCTQPLALFAYMDGWRIRPGHKPIRNTHIAKADGDAHGVRTGCGVLSLAEERRGDFRRRERHSDCFMAQTK